MIQILLLAQVLQSKIFYQMSQSHTLFAQFKQDHQKEYSSLLEEQKKFQIFTENLEKINRMNADHEDTTFGINQFADLSQDEFIRNYLQRAQDAPQYERNQKLIPTALKDIPDSFDWREKGVVTDVKDQGSIGSCWAFSTIGNIEGQHKLAGNDLVSLSVEQVVECDATVDPAPNSKKADCGVFGGWPFLAMQYVMKSGGLATEDDYPYCIGKTCYPCEAEGYNEDRCGPGLKPPACKIENPCKKDVKKTAQINDWKSLSNDENELAQQLIDVGPISVGLDATNLQFYWWGVFDPIFGCSTQLNHAVLMVGYGKARKDYWIIKNSWGPKWGEKGYFRIKRGSGTCGINSDPVTAIINKKTFLQ